MEVLGKLGIDLKLLLAQIINFGLLLLLLKYFLYKPVLKRIEDDETQLKAAKIKEQQLNEKREEFEKQKQKETVAMHRKASKVIKEAEEIAEDIKKKVNREAQDEKKKVMQQIKNRLKEVENAAEKK